MFQNRVHSHVWYVRVTFLFTTFPLTLTETVFVAVAVFGVRDRATSRVDADSSRTCRRKCLGGRERDCPSDCSGQQAGDRQSPPTRCGRNSMLRRIPCASWAWMRIFSTSPDADS
jgi:hypothetical protein